MKDTHRDPCSHCWHYHEPPPDEPMPAHHVFQRCCKCPAVRTIHVEHAREGME